MENNSNEIRVLGFPEAIRTRPGMYLGDVSDTTQLLVEVIGNIQDEVSACSTCNSAIIDQNWNGYQLCQDSGRGMPIFMSVDKPNQTAMEVALTNIHAGSKFGSTSDVRVGMNGCGLKACVACSERFIMMSKVTQDNYNKSLPIVEEVWNSYGPRSKKDIYYALFFEKGYKVYEGVDKLDNLEKLIFSSENPQYEPLPRGFNTIVLFRGDPEIFENTSSKLPLRSLQYFLLIQEKLYKRKIELIVNRERLNGIFKPFKFEIFKTIIPADTSKNKYVTVYTTFETDPELGQKQEFGSVMGLDAEGIHINYIEKCYEDALKNEFKIKHKYLTNGLKLCVIVICEDVVFNSQNKERLKSISKVKQSDFGDITKEFQKIFRNNPEYWQEHVARLNYLADSMKSLSASEKAQKMIDDAQGRNMFKSRVELIEGFSDATGKNRWDCELFLCEGLSPAGSLKSGRHNTQFHAVLPLRGKILSVLDKTVDQALDNKEIHTIFKVIGLGMDVNNVTKDAKSFEEAYELIKKYSRYGKIVIAVDADPDGEQIKKLILYLFGKFGRFLIDFGMVYQIMSPIFEQGDKKFYPGDPLQDNGIFPIGLDPSKPFFRRKGLGAFNSEDIYDIFYNPATRKLIQVTPDGFDYSMKLTEDIEERKKLLFDAGIITNPYGFTDL
jgi:DNA gyrase/topoisomerase IV subunit B|nr:MAG: DNA gyrase B [Bacteriophage sp.]